jgi:putative DNA primase/helicase
MTTTELLNQLLEQAHIHPNPTEYLNREEYGDAELFGAMFAGKVVFDHAEKQWYLWDGTLWVPDQTGKVFTFVGNELAAEYLAAAEIERRNNNTDLSNQFVKRSKLLLHRNRIHNVLELAFNIPGLALKGNEWNTLPLLLPVSNGVINLTDGSFRKAVPTDYFRACVPTEWQGLDKPAPEWEHALSVIFDANRDTIAFMQRLFGYSITGDTKEQVLPILWGDGANGKSTLMDVISIVLGDDFCFSTQADSLMDLREGDGNAARPFVHALRNKRLVWASESKEGRRLNAGLIKQLTGDRFITARALYGRPVTFKQVHKIFLVTNHCPRVPDGDDIALWRRILLVAFRERFVDEPRLPHEHQRDRELLPRLLNETAGILAWLVRGCLAWQEQGLNPPPSVLESTDQYHEDEDLIGHFIEDRLLEGESLEASSSQVYKEYKAWCEEFGNRPTSSKALGQILTRRYGPAVVKRNGKKTERVYQGIGMSM